jgi:hypothetical protein
LMSSPTIRRSSAIFQPLPNRLTTGRQCVEKDGQLLHLMPSCVPFLVQKAR